STRIRQTRFYREGSSVIRKRPTRIPAETATDRTAAEQPGPDVFAKPVGPALDPVAIMTSVGEVPYAWSLDTDALVWGPNVSDVLTVGGAAAIVTGRSYARLLDSEAANSRFDAVTKSPRRDHGSGVAYQVQYALRPP